MDAIIDSMSGPILIVEDDPVQQDMLALLLQRKLGYASIPALNGRSALEELQKNPAIRLVILDLGLPDMNGMEMLGLIVQRHPGLPVIMLTGQKDVVLTVEAMKAGAYDFLTKPVEKERLQAAIQNALKTSLLEKEITRLKRREEGAFTFDQLIGHDGGLADVIRTGRKAAASDIPVLLLGETGTGKEVFARAIHGESRRVGKPFVAVNCGAIPAQLVESTLFGHEKGAFTGAVARSAGRFREADGGTVFLDEIGDLPLDAQVKLLRVLQQKEVMPVGAAHPVPVNVRIISATHRDLAADVESGLFRDDLYFRLNVLQLHMPALRERSGDIPALVHHFIERIAAVDSRPLRDITPRAMAMIARRSWPGNVRELENAIHRAMVMGESDLLDIDDFSALPAHIPASGAQMVATAAGIPPRPLAEIENEAIQNALTYFHGNMTQAATALGLAKSTLYRKLRPAAS